MESIGIKVALPPKVSERTIKLGVRHSSDMMCFPYKVTLGNFIEALEQGANVLLMWDNCGQCRQRHYWKIHEFTLRNLGYEFEIYPVSRATFVPLMKKLSGKGTLKVIKTYKDLTKKIRDFDASRYQWSDTKINIGIIGEIYTCCEERINYDIDKKLKKLGVNPFNTATMSDFMETDAKISFLTMVKDFLSIFSSDLKGTSDGIFMGNENSTFKKYKERAKEYLNGPVGGHGYENIYNLLWMIDNDVRGIIHLLPLSCMPETTVEPIINKLCQDAKIPLLRLIIDETNSDANIDTRVETFAELIKRKLARSRV